MKYYPRFLFKYATINKYTFSNLSRNLLWVSNLDYVNDPCENCAFINTGSPVDFKLVNRFLGEFRLSQYCLCFGLKNNNKTLWNYYADGFRGVCLKYKRSDIEKSLCKAANNNYCSDFIKYTDEKIDLTKYFNKYKESLTQSEYLNTNLFFTKERCWYKEKEFRYSVGTQNRKKVAGFSIRNIKPCHIIVGFKIDSKNMLKIIKICKDNKIKLSIAIPDFSSNGTNLKIEEYDCGDI